MINNENYLTFNNYVKQKKDGFYNLEADKQAIKLYQDEIDANIMKFPNYIAKLDYLIENNYYIDFYQMYSKDEIKTLSDSVYASGFEFQSFMAISKFYDSYALKTGDRHLFLENYFDRVISVSLFLGQGDIKVAITSSQYLVSQQYQPATPTFLNAGKKDSGELVSCFLLEMDDSLNSINFNLSTAMQLSKIGGGVAINLSKLRARSEAIRNNDGVARGVLPVLKLLENAFSYVDQLGQRPGAGAAYLSIFHADVIEFLDTKKINADEKTRIQTLSLGLIVPDKFFELAKNNEDLHMFFPLTVKKAYGLDLDEMDMNVMYDELINNPNVRSTTISAREMLQLIAISQFESGYPYLVFIDEANRANPLKNVGKIKMSNLCTEIFQIQTPSKINNYGIDDEIGYDVSCNLGSLNIANVMEHKDIENAVTTAMRSLTTISDMSSIQNAPGVNKANEEFHAVGLGAMNLHGFLTKSNIGYESEEAKEFASVFFATVNFYSIKASMNISIEKEQTFASFKDSDYYSGEYFNTYLENDYLPISDKVKAVFTDITLPSKADWIKLKQDVHENGLYHSYRMAIAPTQSISYIQNATASIQPIVDVVETRMYGDSITYYPMPFLTRENHFFYKSAYLMDQFKIIDLISVIQPHIDQGISTVLYVTNEITSAHLAQLYYYAWKKGLKSLYYIRTKNLTIEECATCSV